MWGKFFRAVIRREHRMAPLSWLALVGTLIYTIWPLDLFPELLFPIVGYIDDLGLWGVMMLVAGKEKQRWEAGLSAGAVDVTPKRP